MKPVENKELFFNRINPFFAPSTLCNIRYAYMMAKFGHRDQVRKSVDDNGKPIRYFEHLRGAALILIDEVKIVDAEMIITALLHDSLEDTEDLTPEMIEHAFGSNVVTKVKCLSKIPEEGYLERLMMSTDWEMITIKGCDRLFNLRDLVQTDEAFRKKQVAETRDHYYPLFDRMVQLTPPQYQSRTTWLRDEIRRVADGQAALLAR